MRKILVLSSFLVLCLGLLYGVAHADKLSTYAQTKTLKNADQIPVIVGGVSLSNGNINWYDLKEMVSKNFNWADAQQLHGNAINWTDANITNNGINWTDIQASQQAQGLITGINWNDLNPVAGGINWMIVTKSASDNTILCVKGGQIGKCAASFSATGAGSCTCI